MEINVENEKNGEDKGCLDLFHEGDVILYDDHYCLVTEVDKNDDDYPLRVNSLDGGFDEYQDRWIGLSEISKEDYIVGVNLFPASQYHLSIVKNGN